MRYIPLKKNHPDQAWVDKANVLLQQMQAAPDDNARKQIIDGTLKVEKYGGQDVWK